MKRIRIIRKKNIKYKIQERNFFWWDTMIGTHEFDSIKECIDFIYDKYDVEKCTIEYDKAW